MSENNVASKGDFRGDFSRDTFDPMKHFSRVLMQQGRVQLDADWNEQVSILLHYMRQLGRDLMGPHGVPYPDDVTATPELESKNFKIEGAQSPSKSDFTIVSGRYYVNGVLCEIREEQKISYRNQPNYPITETEEMSDGMYLVYLDVWERHLTYVEDDDIREKALGGADTATRAQIVWQVKVKSKPPEDDRNASEKWDKFIREKKYNDFLQVLKKEKQPGTGLLKAQAKKTEVNKEPCLTSPESTYRGAENQLYRVEIHNPGEASNGASFKWSRENGSVIFPITNISDGKITLEHLGRDDRFGLQPGDWVEVLDDDVILRNEANSLLKVKEVERENFQVTLEGTLQSGVGQDSAKHPYLRRWDHGGDDANGITVKEDDNWISLEYGIKIQFPKQTGQSADNALYQTGDYWLIPARTATGDVEWPGPVDKPDAIPPHGVEHHYAPLAIITVEGNVVRLKADIRRQLQKSWSSPN